MAAHAGGKDPLDSLLIELLTNLGESGIAHLGAIGEQPFYHLSPLSVSLRWGKGKPCPYVVGQTDRDASRQIRAQEFQCDVGLLDVGFFAHLAPLAKAVSLLRGQLATLGRRQQRGQVHVQFCVDWHVVGSQAVHAYGHHVVQAGLLELDQFHQRPQLAGAQHCADLAAWLADGDVTSHARRVQPHHWGQWVGRVQQVGVAHQSGSDRASGRLHWHQQRVHHIALQQLLEESAHSGQRVVVLNRYRSSHCVSFHLTPPTSGASGWGLFPASPRSSA